jgi:N-acetylmuramoyl-L-alanine amidase
MIPKNIILHCSATEDSETPSWEAIRRFHTEIRGWRDIGYHYGLEDYEGELVILRGRKPFDMGAHCVAGGRNRDSLGVCVVGEYDTEAPSEERYLTTVALLTSLCFMFHIPPENVYGHREFESGKTCPGLMWDLDKLRKDITSGLLNAEGIGVYLET